MSGITGAVIGVGVAGAVGTAVAGSEAAGATTNATNASIAEQNKALNEQAALSAPYRGIGTAAIPEYERLLGIGPGGTAGELTALQQTPGYQFTKQQGEAGIENAASAQGGISGNTLAALDQYNTGLADQTYQNAVGNAQGAVGLGRRPLLDRLATLAQRRATSAQRSSIRAATSLVSMPT